MEQRLSHFDVEDCGPDTRRRIALRGEQTDFANASVVLDEEEFYIGLLRQSYRISKYLKSRRQFELFEG